MESALTIADFIDTLRPFSDAIRETDLDTFRTKIGHDAGTGKAKPVPHAPDSALRLSGLSPPFPPESDRIPLPWASIFQGNTKSLKINNLQPIEKNEGFQVKKHEKYQETMGYT